MLLTTTSIAFDHISPEREMILTRSKTKNPRPLKRGYQNILMVDYSTVMCSL